MFGPTFGITEETRSSSTTPFPVSNQLWKHKAVLTKVEARTSVKDKYTLLEGVELAEGVAPTYEQVSDDSRFSYLSFIFTSPDGVYTHIENVYEIKADDKKKTVKEKMNNEKIAHFWCAISGTNNAHIFLGVAPNEDGILAFTHENLKGLTIDGYPSYFKGIAQQFNTAKNGDPIFMNKVGQELKPTLLVIKLHRQTRGKGINNLQMSNGNTVERFIEGAKSTLAKLPKDVFDKIEVGGDSPIGGQSIGIPPGTGEKDNSDSPWPSDV